MQETVELRIPEARAQEFLGAKDGVCLLGNTRKIELAASDPRLTKLREIDQELRARGEYLFLYSNVHRRYTKNELASAKALKVDIKHVFEPAGEECGTYYDETAACKYCGAGERQVSDLILDPKRVPKSGNLAIAKTIANEVIVSDAFIEVFKTNRLRGAEFRVVKQRKNPSVALPGWHQLIVNSERLSIVAPTRAGVNVFDDGSLSSPEAGATLDALGIEGSWCDRLGTYRCPLGHTIGLNLLSELTVEKGDSDDWDIASTTQRVGVRRGLLRPSSLLVISPRLRQHLIASGLKGFSVEVVHFALYS